MDNKEWNKFLSDRYGLEGHHFWKHKQSGKWIISHKGCMIIADQEGVVFSKPQYVKTESDNVVLYGTAIITTHDDAGQIVDKEIWTHGEANLQNCYLPYLYAMAEKRLKDRLTLMIISAYGEVYSEIEADEFAAQQKHLEES